MPADRKGTASIPCTPKGLLSSNYRVEGAGHRATLALRAWTEQGSLSIGGKTLEIRKHVMRSGRWTLSQNNKDIITAKKPSCMRRTFEFESPMGALQLSAAKSWRRTMELTAARKTVATIAPAHAFTRRATISVAVAEFDFPTLCFAFWLTALTWRRQAQAT